MLLSNPFAAIATTGVDAQVLEVVMRSTANLTVPDVLKLQRGEASKTAIRDSLKRFAEQGIVSETTLGRTHGYALNRQHLLAEAFTLIAQSKSRFISMLSDAIGTWDTKPVVVSLFGSAARGTMTAKSDIDLFFVLPEGSDFSDENISSLCAQASAWTGNDVRPLIYSEEEIRDMPIFRSIIEDGITVYGDRGWLSRAIKR